MKLDANGKIKVMQAFINGEMIECFSYHDGIWKYEPEPLWDWCNFDYRIKQKEPKEIWVNEYEGNKFNYDNKDQALKNARGDVIRKAVHYKEVIEND